MGVLQAVPPQQLCGRRLMPTESENSISLWIYQEQRPPKHRKWMQAISDSDSARWRCQKPAAHSKQIPNVLNMPHALATTP
ncbi:unnamed protein product [Ceratitis capitata]|uniref:(Mediterranean fruit fly) hypothetical protein n=1 Tax=Ceratitis capitata TaxID=7213 RepID=A0A811V400_CERCA|nr:unnamed protein product [Ceratitis capitata]